MMQQAFWIQGSNDSEYDIRDLLIILDFQGSKT